MCTVTFLPIAEGGFILTSSRDVSYLRAPAEEPKEYDEDGIRLLYPKDGKAGGTWIGSSIHQRLICLLNGGFDGHQLGGVYARSRGLVVKDLLKAADFVSACKEISLDAIEPFTLVVIEWKKNFILQEFVWDGVNRHLKQLDWLPQVWSSSTLYTSAMKSQRTKWFNDWLKTADLTPDEILKFHRDGGIGDPNIDVFLRRDKVGTVSITQFTKYNNQEQMKYLSCAL